MSASVTSGTYPRAAHVVQQPGQSGLQRLSAALWQSLVRAGARRAQPELLRLASLRASSDPALAAQLRQAARELMQG